MPDRVLDLLIAFFFKDAIPKIGFLVVKALLRKDRQIVTIVDDALKESDHFFKRDRELVLREKVIKDWPELIGTGMSMAAIKREIEKRRDKKLRPYQWTRLGKVLCLALPTGRPKKVSTKR